MTPAQIERWSLPTRPTKLEGNRHAKGWAAEQASVELDAIPPQAGSAIWCACVIGNHVDQRQLAALRQIEAEEREQLRLFGQSLGRRHDRAEVPRRKPVHVALASPSRWRAPCARSTTAATWSPRESSVRSHDLTRGAVWITTGPGTKAPLCENDRRHQAGRMFQAAGIELVVGR